MDVLRRYSNQHFQTYGREVVFVDYAASGPSENDEAMKRDAINIAAKKPFAVIEGEPAAPMPTVLFRDLAQRKILCMCSTSMSRGVLRLACRRCCGARCRRSTLYARQTAEYVGKRLGRQAGALRRR